MNSRTRARWLLFLLFAVLSWTTRAQGLRLRGLDCTIGERTSLDLFARHRPAVRDSLVLRFDVRLESDRYGLGYLCRIETDLIPQSPVINLLFERVSGSWVVRLIWEGQRFLCSLPFSVDEISTGRWFPVKIDLDLIDDSVSLTVDDRWVVSDTVDLPDRIHPRIVFGRHEEQTDVMPASIRNITLNERRRSWFFPLSGYGDDLSSGGVFFRQHAKVSNPYWLVEDASRWNRFFSNHSSTYQCAGYDSQFHRFWALSVDSIRQVGLMSRLHSDQAFSSPCPVPVTLGTGFVEPKSHALYVYDMCLTPEQMSAGQPSMARLHPGSLTWEPVDTDAFDYQFHHHNEWVDTLANRLVIYGGYGFRKYNGIFFSHPLEGQGWSKLPPVHGDALWPRFMGAMGCDPSSGLLYFFGGKGNESGEQIVGAQYLYSLHSVDPRTMECRKCWQIPWKGDNIVTGRNMIIDGSGHFYVLGYNEAHTRTNLFLYRFSMEDGSFEVMADAIPFYSDRITCVANLYFDPDYSKLIATVEESADDIESLVSAYVLDYPPKPFVPIGDRSRSKRRLAWGALFFLLFFAALILAARLYQKRIRQSRDLLHDEKELSRPNSILLFGGIVVRDREGEDISARFTGKIRQLFCMLLRRGKRGISSKHLSSILWPDRPESETKNVRGVTIHKLRSLFAQMDGLSLVSRDKRFYLETKKPFWCDYSQFYDILSDRWPDRDQLIRILSRGPFLMEETDPVYDKMKEEVESQVERVMMEEMPRRFAIRQYAVCQTCANILFGIDPLNEDALKYSIRSLLAMEKDEEAKALYNRFITRYLRDYGEEFAQGYETFAGPRQP